ncbi:MAG TPA: hypothetical protein H9756_03810 [Candidatus Mediterraneibacter gallistercoris]|uniref:Uncharacterized protein n=1 Tax=Candidatus Mediterraneibacter gallistercoris TaxID=2838671 RepID=A0A9D2T2M1_9FIRM|nr:hypothetical protein [Candidatus Mediterraneibacter gallistercoris]
MNTVGQPYTQSNAGYGSQRTQYNTRVESSADPEVNKRLFRIYEILIQPIHDIENAVNNIESHKERIKQLENHNFVPKFLDLAIKVVLFLVALFVLHPLTDTIVYWISDMFDGFLGIITELLGLLLSLFVFVIIAFIAGEIVHNMINKSLGPQKQPEIKKENLEIAALQQQIQSTINNIKHAIVFVPPAYRTSDALSFFVRAYHNSRVDNLKEAVNAYEMHMEAEHTRSMLKEQIKVLQDIQFQNAIMLDELDSLRSDIWLSNYICW